METVGEPADGKRLPAAGGVVGQILFPDVALGGKVGRDVLGYPSHQAALVVAGEQGERRSLGLVLLLLAHGHTDKEE